jgi:hypothetical protein
MKFLLLTFVLSLSLNSFAQQGPTEICPFDSTAQKVTPGQSGEPEDSAKPATQSI